MGTCLLSPCGEWSPAMKKVKTYLPRLSQWGKLVRVLSNGLCKTHGLRGAHGSKVTGGLSRKNSLSIKSMPSSCENL
jgi:hypothetical protein